MTFISITIADAINSIERHDFVLPAIQREFVWGPDRITRFFDSLMQHYPVGTLLFWQVLPENSNKYKFYDFVRDYHERDAPHCPALPPQNNRPLTAILDGQQRLTALNIGLRGSLAMKEPRKHWNNSDAFPPRHLYLDLIREPTEEEEGEAYPFRFLTERQAASTAKGPYTSLWYRVSDILNVKAAEDLLEWKSSVELNQAQHMCALKRLTRLFHVVNTEKLLSYYLEQSQDLERVLQIFIRMNSGGMILSYSDLLLSIAVAQWAKLDARQEIIRLVDEMNSTGGGFTFSKDFVLKGGLMLTDIASVGFKVQNFNRENMSRLETAWNDVRQALLLTAQLAASYGFTGTNLRAESALLPIAYYLYQRQLGDNYLYTAGEATDRQEIKTWLIRSLLKASGIWGSGLDTLLTALRSTIHSDGHTAFPVAAIDKVMAARGRSLDFTPEEIDDLVDLKYGDKRLFPLMTLLFDFVDTRNHFHIDHVFPISRFSPGKLRQLGITEAEIAEWRDHADRLGNLQLLEGGFNQEKSAKLPAEWLKATFPSANQYTDYVARHCLGDVPNELKDFPIFYGTRRSLLRERIEQLLSR
jgi:hypothetical protein